MSATRQAWRDAVRRRAVELDFALTEDALELLVEQSQLVLANNEHLHLTTVVEPTAFAARHVGESLEGAAWLVELGLDAGRLLDLGSGNGYPGLAIALVLPRTACVLAEASPAKARFLERSAAELGVADRVQSTGQVQRPDDLQDPSPFDAIVTRAMGGWARIVPRMAERVPGGGAALVWAGDDAGPITSRDAWVRRWSRLEPRALRGRERSWIWGFRRISAALDG